MVKCACDVSLIFFYFRFIILLFPPLTLTPVTQSFKHFPGPQQVNLADRITVQQNNTNLTLKKKIKLNLNLF